MSVITKCDTSTVKQGLLFYSLRKHDFISIFLKLNNFDKKIKYIKKIIKKIRGKYEINNSLRL